MGAVATVITTTAPPPSARVFRYSRWLGQTTALPHEWHRERREPAECR
jgi:hypothetical protein